MDTVESSTVGKSISSDAKIFRRSKDVEVDASVIVTPTAILLGGGSSSLDMLGDLVENSYGLSQLFRFRALSLSDFTKRFPALERLECAEADLRAMRSRRNALNQSILERCGSLQFAHKDVAHEISGLRTVLRKVAQHLGFEHNAALEDTFDYVEEQCKHSMIAARRSAEADHTFDFIARGVGGTKYIPLGRSLASVTDVLFPPQTIERLRRRNDQASGGHSGPDNCPICLEENRVEVRVVVARVGKNAEQKERLWKVSRLRQYLEEVEDIGKVIQLVQCPNLFIGCEKRHLDSCVFTPVLTFLETADGVLERIRDCNGRARRALHHARMVISVEDQHGGSEETNPSNSSITLPRNMQFADFTQHLKKLETVPELKAFLQACEDQATLSFDNFFIMKYPNGRTTTFRNRAIVHRHVLVAHAKIVYCTKPTREKALSACWGYLAGCFGDERRDLPDKNSEITNVEELESEMKKLEALTRYASARFSSHLGTGPDDVRKTAVQLCVNILLASPKLHLEAYLATLSRTPLPKRVDKALASQALNLRSALEKVAQHLGLKENADLKAKLDEVERECQVFKESARERAETFLTPKNLFNCDGVDKAYSAKGSSFATLRDKLLDEQAYQRLLGKKSQVLDDGNTTESCSICLEKNRLEVCTVMCQKGHLGCMPCVKQLWTSRS
ncbi:Hypothetical Protein FCC1311_086162 [Hondaea fermentalgiana]|uniref:Uncharacterized protein n=1 Tax=Hondaea fermentalgiana TaxID=2315210 RepID=A0A2R5GVG4_9STRA|nr:Hypothetical Protein FCC1311_086162 [Hondaea fermentalgiana]|eukprot:GBG32391.1 Hypothetical Protein FCC1311_086162 [Hondaea fermentalgiana]